MIGPSARCSILSTRRTISCPTALSWAITTSRSRSIPTASRACATTCRSPVQRWPIPAWSRHGKGRRWKPLLEPARRKFRMAREAGADHVAELRGVLALPYLSRWPRHGEPLGGRDRADEDERTQPLLLQLSQARHWPHADRWPDRGRQDGHRQFPDGAGRSEENKADIQSLMRISYAVFGLKKKNSQQLHHDIPHV